MGQIFAAKNSWFQNSCFPWFHFGLGLAGAALFFMPQTARAQLDSETTQTIEISPLGGFGGASPAFGLRGLMEYGNVGLELAGDQMVGHSAVLFPLTLDFIINLTDTHRVIPYGVIGGGLFLTLPSASVGSRSISTLGICYGGGLRYYFTPTFGVRAESKLFLTQIDAQTDDGGTRQELLAFQSLNIGVILGFR